MIFKTLFFVLLYSLSLPVFAEESGDIENDNITGGSREFSYVRYSNEQIQLRIQEQVRIVCCRGLCTLFSVTTNHNEFTTEFSIGASAGNCYGGIGSNCYGGGSSGGGDNIIIVPGNGGSIGEVQPYVGLTLKYRRGNCTQRVNVPESLYIAMNSFLYGLINEDGTPRRGFTPADEAMIMFYTTIMKQATGCRDSSK